MAYLTSLGFQILQSRTQVFDNFQNDTQLEADDGTGKIRRESFYEFTETYPGTHIDFDTFCNNGYIYSNKFKGITYPRAIKNSVLGHSQTKSKFADILQIGKGDPSIMSNDVLNSLEDVIYTSDKTKKRTRLKLMRLEYDKVEFGRKMTWSYVDNNYATDFFENTELKELPCVLGLPEHDSPRYILSHEIANTYELLQPTAIDAGVDNNLWRPGGKTLPLADCIAKPGKDEVVHKPNVFNNIIDLAHNK